MINPKTGRQLYRYECRHCYHFHENWTKDNICGGYDLPCKCANEIYEPVGNLEFLEYKYDKRNSK